MSTDYCPGRASVGVFNANVHGKNMLGYIHRTFGLPLDPFQVEMNRKYGGDVHRAPYSATARETVAWANTLTAGLRFVDVDDEYRWFVVAWRDFLATCEGYEAI